MPNKLIDTTKFAGMADRFNFSSFMKDAKPKRASDKWYKMAVSENGPAEVLIFDEIGFWGVTAEDFIKDFEGLQADDINIRLNSPGGSVFDGLAIYNSIASSPKNVTVTIEGWAASIASVIAMAADSIRISEAAQIMIHKPWSFVVGNDDDMMKEVDVLRSLEDAIIDIYQARTDGDREIISDWVKNETWFKGQAAVDAGFADEVIPLKKKMNDSAKPATSLSADFFSNMFCHLPDDVKETLETVSNNSGSAFDFKNSSVDEFKSWLKSFGASNSVAEGIANKGFYPNPRDVDGASQDQVNPRDVDTDQASTETDSFVQDMNTFLTISAIKKLSKELSIK